MAIQHNAATKDLIKNITVIESLIETKQEKKEKGEEMERKTEIPAVISIAYPSP